MQQFICDRCGVVIPKGYIVPPIPLGDLCDPCYTKFAALRQEWEEERDRAFKKFMEEEK